MDIVIPSHLIRNFSSALSCLSKIGKDVYWEFDSVTGLSLRTINDAKSSYACWRYKVTFFERCSMKRRRQHTEDVEKVSYRIASRSLNAIVRGRKAASLRIQEIDNALSFEYGIEQRPGTVLTVIHEIPMVDAESLCSVPDFNEASELVASPKVYFSLLEALPTSVYAALIVRKDSSVSASSFSLLDTSNEKALKSETACDITEFLDFDFVSNRDTMGKAESMPEDVNQEVILVFHIKEPKLFFQFCSTVKIPAVCWSFHWGGKPIVLVAEAETYTAELVIATLDHEKLTSMRTMENRRTSQQQQRNADNAEN
jgi:Rad9